MSLKLRISKASYLLLLLCIIVFSNSLYAQISFEKTYGNADSNRANAVIKTKAGGYAFTGSYDVDGFFSNECYLVATDETGDTLWAKTYGSKVETEAFKSVTGSGNEAFDLLQTNDDGFLFIGERHEIVGGQSDVYAVKTDKDGQLLWGKVYGGPQDDYGYAVTQTEDNGFIIAGFTESFGAGIRDLYLIKIDSAGELLWTKTFGGTSIDSAFSMQETSDGGIIITGFTFSFSDSSDIYVLRCDANGDILWQKTYGGASNEIGYSIIETLDGGYIICGETESFGAGTKDAYLVKVDVDGILEWSKTYGAENFESGNSIIQVPNGDYIFAGYTRSFGEGGQDIFVVRTDQLGNLIWTKTYGGSFDDAANSILATTDNAFIVTGFSKSFGSGFSDVYLVKTNGNGNTGCEQLINQTITLDAPTTVQTISSMVGEGTVSNATSIRVGSTRTQVADVCDFVNSSDNVNEENHFKIFPNPAIDHLIIEAKDSNDYSKGHVQIYDLLGTRIKSDIDLNTQIDISELACGVYVVNVNIADKNYAYRFIKH